MYITIELTKVDGSKIIVVPKYIESLESIGIDRIKVTMISGKSYAIQETMNFLTSIIPR
jgi:uncharacterized protein YlzI (FlbEa/FlbD family)